MSTKVTTHVSVDTVAHIVLDELGTVILPDVDGSQ